MRLDVDLDHEITRRTSHTVVAFLRNPEVHACVDPFGHVDGFSDVGLGAAFAVAGGAGVADDLALAAADSADLLNPERALLHELVALSAAAIASGAGGAGPRFASFARAADVDPGEGDLFLHAVDRVHEFDLHVEDDVVAPGRGLVGRAPRLRAAAAEELLELLEHVSLASPAHARLLEEVVEAARAREGVALEGAARTRLRLFVAAHASLVVNGPLVVVGECLVGSGMRRLTRWPSRTSPSLQATCSRRGGTSWPA